MKKRKLMSFLMASVLSLSVVSGCSVPETPENSSQTTTVDTSEIDELKQMVKDLSAEIEELRGMLSLPEGALYGENTEISDDEGAVIDNLLLEKRQTVLADSGKITSVKQRDWDKYASRSAKNMLSHNEAVFYDRLDEVCRTYLENPTANMTKYANYYTIGGAKYSDLKLTKSDARNVFTWFKYNNPQYYFLKSGTGSNSTQIYLLLFDFAANLKDIGSTTNELFDKLDGWIDECSDDETTNYQKLIAINKKVCESIIYDPVVSNKDNRYSEEESNKAAGEENQSMYSVLMTPETVCAGYAQTLTAMANAMGIDALTALSDTHAWNTVKFDDGLYYYIDICWNDKDDGFNTNWFGVGSLFANDPIHIYEATTAANWAPQIEYNDYRVTDKDLGGTAKTLAKPAPKVVGSGDVGFKIEWEAVPDAEQYQVQAYCNGEVVRNVLTADTSAYIPYANGASNVSVMIRSVGKTDGMTSGSDWTEMTVSDKGNGTKPAIPTDLKQGTTDNGGLSLNWKNSTNTSVIFCYGTDSTLSKATMAYAVTNKIGWKTYNPTETTYFRIVSTSESIGKGTYSDPITFSYSKDKGITIIEGAVDKPDVSAPTNLDITLKPATEIDGRKLGFEWSTVKDADSYEFQLSRKFDFSVITGRLSTKNTSATCKNIPDTSVHYYARVRAVKNDNGKSVYSKWTVADYSVPDNTTTAQEKPAIPQNMKGSESGNKKIISWDKVEGATGYVVTLYKDSERKQISKEFSTEKTTITLSPLTAGKTYYFSIRSVVSKNGKDTYSDYFNFVVKFKGTTPASVQNVTGKEDGTNEIISWDKVDGATGYIVTLYKDSERKQISKEFNTTEPTITLGAFTAGRTYYFAIRAVNTVDGENYYSDYANFQFTFKGTSTSVEKPAVVQNIKATVNGEAVTFSWDEVKGATAYIITRYTDSTRNQIMQEFTPTTKTSKTINPFKEGQTYYYSIRAVKTVDGKDYYSDYHNFNYTFKSTEVEKPAVPQNIKVTENGEKVTFSWDKVSGATSYIITAYTDSTRKKVSRDFNPTTKPSKTITYKYEGTYYYGIRAVKTIDGKDYYSDYKYFNYTFKGTTS